MPTYINDTGTTQVVRGVAGHNHVVGDGEEVRTFQILPGEGWTKTSDEPHYALGRVAVVAVAGTGSITGLLSSRFIELRADADISVTANTATNPGAYPLRPDEPFWIDNTRGVIDSLHFSGTGAVTVVGLDS